jgi:hypothetical protein
MAIFGGCAIVCGISSLWLPETALSTLHQTIEETEESPENYGIPCLRKPGATKAQDHEMEHLHESSDDKEERRRFVATNKVV